MKRLDLIDKKLQAIRDKDTAEIVSEKVPLPISLSGLSTTEQVDKVDEWLKVRIVVLERAKKLSESAIQDEIAKLYKALCEKCKKLADDAVGDMPREMGTPCNEDYETFMAWHLYQFSLGVFS